MSKSIQQVVNSGQCCSCGICTGVCPKSAISLEMKKGIPTPRIHEENCIQCGLCVDVCPGKSGIDEVVSIKPNEVKTYCIGDYKATEICHTTNEVLLKKATSGGVISSIISTILREKSVYGYVAAFVVKSNNFETTVKTEICKEPEQVTGSEKSRYISVSQEDVVRYMLAHREEKIIITGTSCAIQGISNVIRKFHLKRENYLLIGLFCDKLMTYHVWDYFNSIHDNEGILTELYFRDKEKNGWPGDLKLVQKNTTVVLPKKMRSQVKDFFCHPRCIYCIDKLNRYSDISVGDNYTGENTYPMGSSCVIIRSDCGMKAYQSIKDTCVTYNTSIKKIVDSQEVLKRLENYRFTRFKFSKEKFQSAKLGLKFYYKLIKIAFGNEFYGRQNVIKFFIKLEEIIKNAF